jgi:DNA-binding HxlR family transcriptional regulator
MKPTECNAITLCPAVGFSLIVGGKYKLRILWCLAQKSHRYGEIRRSVLKGCLGKPVTARVLSRELKELAQRELISRTQLNTVPLMVSYSLTDTGRELLPILHAIVAWGRTGAHERILGGVDALLQASSLKRKSAAVSRRASSPSRTPIPLHRK